MINPKRRPLIRRVSQRVTPRVRLISAIIILTLTTLYWSLLGAIVHQHNADQLADPKLFSSWEVLNQAVFPAQHSFLLKWPLFALIQLTHGATWLFYAVTILVSVVTVGGLAIILARIEKRPQMLGLLYLALASCLLLVPIEPIPGSLLPVSLAMLASRNIEYLVYIVALYAVIKQTSYRISRWFGVAGLLLTVLFASDQLFVSLSLGGSLLLLSVGLLARQPRYRTVALRWLIVTGVAFVASLGVMIGLAASGLGQFLGTERVGLGPYAVGLTLKDKVLGLGYGLLGLAANFGANPVSATVIAKELPRAVASAVAHTSIIAYLTNAIILVAAMIAAVKLIGRPFIRRRQLKFITSPAVILSYGLIATSLAAIVLFIGTNHYYAVDARYLTIALFAGFISLATYQARHRPAKPSRLLYGVVLVSIVIGSVSAYAGFERSLQAVAPLTDQNHRIAAALKHHPVTSLLADYWRVYPITTMNQSVTPIPLSDCTHPRYVLASGAWRTTALQKSFAYVLTTTPTVTGFPGCSLYEIRTAYGSPSDSIVIAGTTDHPKTLLLFYDNGVNHPKQNATVPNDTSLLRKLDELDDAACAGQTVVQIVAHQDDDILFMNPDLIHGLQAEDCVRSIYLTAGDAGSDDAYWLSREEGTKAAYAEALGVINPRWTARDVQLSPQIIIKVVKLSVPDRRVSLLFLRLPDGNPTGGGFAAHNYESLARLNTKEIPTIHAVDGRSVYSRDTSVMTLATLMDHYQPAVVRTQTPHNYSERYHDHSDHLATGALTDEAFDRYLSAHPDSTIRHYIGYPVHAQPINVFGEDLALKRRMFFTYGAHDPSVCITDEGCEKAVYGQYLDRQYSE